MFELLHLIFKKAVYLNRAAFFVRQKLIKIVFCTLCHFLFISNHEQHTEENEDSADPEGGAERFTEKEPAE